MTEYRFERRDALYDPVTGQPIYIDGTPAAAAESNGLRADLLFSFEPTPGTVVFLGYGASLAKAPLDLRHVQLHPHVRRLLRQARVPVQAVSGPGVYSALGRDTKR